MLESLILVDDFGHRSGTAERVDCHIGQGMRHRAFVTFLSDSNGSLLIQKRQTHKLGGGRWDVSATSHVRSNETFAAAIRRCLAHELGITQAISSAYLLSYTYIEHLGSHAENEFCSLFRISYYGEIIANPDELIEHRWVPVAQLTEWYRSDSKLFTQWFGEAFERFLSHSEEEWCYG